MMQIDYEALKILMENKLEDAKAKERAYQEALKQVKQSKQSANQLSSTSANQSYWGYVPPSNPATIPYTAAQPLTRTAQPTPNTLEAYQTGSLGNYFDSVKKSQFEEIIDSLFSFDEKWDFLKSIGYSVNGNAYLNPTSEESIVYKEIKNPDDVTEHMTIHRAFLKEISIKFKNMLISKATLKIKI